MKRPSFLPRRGESRHREVAGAVLTRASVVILFLSLAGSGCGHVSDIRSQGQTAAAPATTFRFDDVAQQAGLDYKWPPFVRPMTIRSGVGNGCGFLDYDDDGNLDILLVGKQLALYRGDGRGHFTDVTHETGLDRIHGDFVGCAVGDYDNDGYPDIYLTAYRGGALLHNERGKSFRDVTAQSGIPPQPWSTAAAWVDIDGDGKPDLFIGNYVVFDSHTKPQLCDIASVMTACPPTEYRSIHGLLYHNLGGGRFKDVTPKWSIDKLSGAVLGLAPGDFDGSGRQGIYIANDGRLGNLLKNSGRRFEDIGRRSSTVGDADGKPQNGMGVDWGDYDNDGRLDLSVATFEAQSEAIYHNDGNDLFTEESTALSVRELTRPYVKFGEKWLDVDNSGWLDLMIANGHVADNVHQYEPHVNYREPMLLLLNAHGVAFGDASSGLTGGAGRPIVGRGLAIGDYDNDGRVDALVVDNEGSPLLLHNETPNAGHWLELNLIGTKSSRDGEGALVTVTAGDLKLLRLCTTAGSYMSASDKRVHVGLAGASMAESVTVRWPSGHADTYKNIPADHQVTLREGDPKPVVKG